MTYLWFAAAVIVMSAAHFIRILRWELFIKVYEKPDLKRLLRALSLGYAVNYVVPYKLGDIARGFYAGRKMKNGKALGLSTVIVDRYLDIFCVGLIFLGLSVFGGGESLKSASRFYIIFFFALIGATLLIYLFRGLLKKLIRLFASLFNTRLEGSLLKFAWATIWNFKDIVLKINKLALIASSVFMWALYIASYYLFAMAFSAVAEGSSWVDVFLMLFGENGVKASTIMLSLINGEVGYGQLYLAVFTVAPLLILLLISFIVKKASGASTEDTDYLSLLPQLNPEERLVFLDKYFSDKNRDYINNYLKINHGISVIRDYSAGSNATTMLCVDKRGTFFRKYAFGPDGEKLAQQVKWIEEETGKLPLPEILKSDVNEFYCYYDMPYLSNAVGLFEFAHSNPVAASVSVLKHVFDTLEKSLYNGPGEKASAETVEKYVDSKVTKNLDKIRNARKLKAICDYDTIVINGREYKNLPHFLKYLEKGYLTKVFAEDRITPIHGDLTVENIVCVRDGAYENGFYLIDPNTGNVLDSPNLDYGKMLQSLHGGYEFLMSVKNVTVEENRIDFMFAKSSVYTDLYAWMGGYLAGLFDGSRIRSIYFHEVVHWLRLMPYKIDKDIRTAPVFYAGMIMVMNDVFDRFAE